MDKKVYEYEKEIQPKSAPHVIEWAVKEFGAENIAFATSLGAEDQVITDMLLKISRDVEIFTLDTGRLPQETYDTIEATRKYFKTDIQMLYPDNKELEKMVTEKGPDLFYESIENRKLCCNIRKVKPLKKKLKNFKVWICGLRKKQVVTRINLNKIEWDHKFKLIKINPVIYWSESDVWDYIHKNSIPYNQLHDQGYTSIGCAPCSRSIKPGEDFRAGRWWWEQPEQKECGLHWKAEKLTGNSE
ncbi:MAG: phosphoadenylyl-sulfate reductase [bacterium]|nr:phosphoadenylyl-sulfate reductase [bacterium]